MNESAAIPTSPAPRWAFAPYAIIAVAHVLILAIGPEVLAYPTKLTLMPALAAAVLWALRGTTERAGATTLLLLAIGFSWLGDGAAFFFPFFASELPAMLLCFGVAHVLYIWLFLRELRSRSLPGWTVAYAVWWIGMLVVLWPHLGALALGVAAYGLVLGGTAAAATRGSTVTAIGGAFFLASDTLLALRLFLPGADEAVAGPWIMLTYTLGQGLLGYGAVRLIRGGGAATPHPAPAHPAPARGR